MTPNFSLTSNSPKWLKNILGNKKHWANHPQNNETIIFDENLYRYEHLIVDLIIILLDASWSCLHCFWVSLKSSRSFCISFSFSLSSIFSTTTCEGRLIILTSIIWADKSQTKFVSFRFYFTNLLLYCIIFLMAFFFETFKLLQVFFGWRKENL